MSDPRQRIGVWGEAVAAACLQSRGSELIRQNIRTPQGEIDLAVHKDELLIFMEVKTLASVSFGYPEDSVTRRKQAHMLAATEYYLQEIAPSFESWQFDVIAIEGKPGRQPKITPLENVLA